MNTRISINSHGTPIETELFSPNAAPNSGAVVIAHGSDGMNEPWAAMIREYARELAGKGFTVLIPHYFNKTGTTAGPRVFSEMQTKLSYWEEAVSDAVAHARTLPGISASRLGLLGFSLGGHLCLRLRESASTLVEFFAPELRLLGGLRPAAAPAPHVQIHHGLADLLVPFAETQAIKAALLLEGTKPEVFSYEGATHGFAGADPNNATARRSSKKRALAFLEKNV